MGRGRAKAKQTKVARELKYRSFGTDFGSLAAELHHEGSEVPAAYADLADDQDDPRFSNGSTNGAPYDADEDDDEGYAELRKSG